MLLNQFRVITKLYIEIFKDYTQLLILLWPTLINTSLLLLSIMLPFLQLFIYFIPCILDVIIDSLSLINTVCMFFLNPLSDILFRPGTEAMFITTRTLTSQCIIKISPEFFHCLDYNKLNPIITKHIPGTITNSKPLNKLSDDLTSALIWDVNPNLSPLTIKNDSTLRVLNLYKTLLNNLPNVSTKVYTLDYFNIHKHGGHFCISDLSKYTYSNRKNEFNNLGITRQYLTSIGKHKSIKAFNKLEEGDVITYYYMIGHKRMSMLINRPYNPRDIFKEDINGQIYPNYFMLSSALMGCVGHLDYTQLPDIYNFVSMYNFHLNTYKNDNIIAPLSDIDSALRDYLSRVQFLRLNQYIFEDMVELIKNNNGMLSEGILKEVFLNCIVELKKTL